MSQHHQLIKNDPRWLAARQACFDRDDRTCVQCGSTEQLEADHIVPLSVVLADEATAYLAYDLENLQTLCSPCNKRKADTIDGQLVRQPWISPKYRETLGVVVAGS